MTGPPRLRVTESELIRQGIDRVLAGSERLPPDDAAWAEEKRFIAARMRGPQARRPRTWTRDELYDA